MSFDLIVFSPSIPVDIRARLQSAIEAHDRLFFVRLRGEVAAAAGFDLYFGRRVSGQTIDDVPDDDCMELPIRQLENDEEIDDFLSSPDLSDDAKSRLKTMRFSGMISSSAGRSLDGYVLQCLAAAAFVEASAGALCDPQATEPEESLFFGSAATAQMQHLAKEYAQSLSEKPSTFGVTSGERRWLSSTRSMTLLAAALGATLSAALHFASEGKLSAALDVILIAWGVGPYIVVVLIAIRREPSLALLVATLGMFVCDIGYAATLLLPLPPSIVGMLAGFSAGKAIVIAPIVYAVASYLANRHRDSLKSA